MNKEEKLISIINSYSRKIFPKTNPDKALFEYERFCIELIEENKELKRINRENKRKILAKLKELEEDIKDIMYMV